jgi:hypothetical protein
MATNSEHDTFEEREIRPIQPIAPPPRTNAVTRLAERLEKDYDHTPEAARAIAEAVEDPKLARDQLSRLSRVPVRGGTLYTLDVRVNALRCMIDPVNPRTVGSTDYPAAASNGSRPKYWAPRDLSVDPDAPGELTFEAGSPEDLADALDDAKAVLRDQNPMADSIGLNGVFFALTVMPWRIEFEDGTEVAAIVARDGSSRLNGAQENLGIGPADAVLGAVADPRRSRAVVGEIAKIVNRAQNQISTSEAARIIIAYEPDPGSDADLLDVVDEFVALLHLDPPTPWAPPAEAQKRADIVIEELRREGLLKPPRAEYFAGMLDQDEAADRNLPAHADERAAEILHFFVKGPSGKVRRAIARGIRQLTGKGQARKEHKTPIIASLVLRGAHWTSPNKRKSAESTLPRVYGLTAFWDRDWRRTQRSPGKILDAALDDLEAEKGFSRSILELAVLGSYWLVTHGALGRESFGQSGEEDKDHRSPSAVLGDMCRSERGLKALHRAIVDGRAGRPPRRIDEDGDLETTGSGKAEPMTNDWVRATFRPIKKPAGKGPEVPGLTPQERVAVEIRTVREEVADIAARIDRLAQIAGADGLPVVDEIGVPMSVAQQIDEEFRFGVMTHLYRWGGIHQGRAAAGRNGHGDLAADESEYAAVEEES